MTKSWGGDIDCVVCASAVAISLSSRPPKNVLPSLQRRRRVSFLFFFIGLNSDRNGWRCRQITAAPSSFSLCCALTKRSSDSLLDIDRTNKSLDCSQRPTLEYGGTFFCIYFYNRIWASDWKGKIRVMRIYIRSTALPHCTSTVCRRIHRKSWSLGSTTTRSGRGVRLPGSGQQRRSRGIKKFAAPRPTVRRIQRPLGDMKNASSKGELEEDSSRASVLDVLRWYLNFWSNLLSSLLFLFSLFYYLSVCGSLKF